MMTPYSQQDVRWSSEKLGDSQETIGKKGCLTCCLAMAESYFAGPHFLPIMTPIEIAHNVNNYTKEGLIWWKHLNFPKMKFVERTYSEDAPRIQDALKDPRKAVILNVSNGQHWVIALSKAWLRNDYVVFDPWTGKKTLAKGQYHNITGAAYFEQK